MITRIGTLLAVVGAGAAFGALATGASWLALPSLLPVVAGAGLARAGRRATPDRHWAPTSSLRSNGRSLREVAPSARQVAQSLARVEARELALHPWFGAGIGLCAFMAIGFGGAGNTDGTWESAIQDLPFLAHPLVGMAILASHRAVTRAGRDGTEEYLDACPTAPATRTVGALGSLWVPPVVLAGFFAAYIAATAASNPDLSAPVGPAVLHLASGLTLGVGGVALGVALGRWVRFGLAPVLAIVAIVLVSPRLAQSTDGRYATRMIMSTFPPVGESTPNLSTGQMWLHLAWLLAITAATIIVALARPRRDPLRRSPVLASAGALS